MWFRSWWTIFHDLAVVQAENGGTGTGGETSQSPFGSMWIILVGFIAIMYFFLYAPQKKRDKERRDMLASLAKGDRAITTGGVIGTIVGLTEKTAVLRVSEEPNVKIEFLRSAIARKLASDIGLEEESEKK